MINRDKILNELAVAFTRASNNPPRDVGQREAGLHAVLDILERDYIIMERDQEDVELIDRGPIETWWRNR